jgi:hypothetical protein
MIDLDKFSHYKADGEGGVQGKIKRLKVQNKDLISNLVYLTSLDGKKCEVSVARLTYHQYVRKLELGEKVYVSPNTALTYLDRLTVYKVGDFNPNMVKKLDILEKQDICSSYEADTKINLLAEMYRVSSETVREILRGNSAGCAGSYLYQKRCPPGGKRGDYLKKVNEKTIEKILLLYGQNKSKAAIGRELFLSAETVSKYIKREELKANGSNN